MYSRNLFTEANTRKTLRVHKIKKEQDSMGEQRYSILYSSKNREHKEACREDQGGTA